MLALMSKKGENEGTLYNFSLAILCALDSLFTKASYRMVLEIGCRGLVLQILKVLNSSDSGLALPSCTWKEVAHAAFMVLNRDTVGLEESVYQGMSTPFQNLYNVWP